jgi:hypothetical protein
MSVYLLQNKGNQLKDDGTYEIESRISKYLENQGGKHLEEEKQAQEYEEEEKKEDGKVSKTPEEAVQIDSFIFYLAAAFIVTPWP